MTNGKVKFAAFMPPTPSHRADGKLECSIDWMDDPSVELFARADQEKAKYGLAIVPTAVLLTTVRADRVARPERHSLINDPHHGNIVFAQQERQGLSAVCEAIALVSAHRA